MHFQFCVFILIFMSEQNSFIGMLIDDIDALGVDHTSTVLASAGLTDGTPTIYGLHHVLDHTIYNSVFFRFSEASTRERCLNHLPKTDIGRKVASAFLQDARDGFSRDYWSVAGNPPRKVFIDSCPKAEPRFLTSFDDALLMNRGSRRQPTLVMNDGVMCGYIKHVGEPTGIALSDIPILGFHSGTIFRPLKLILPKEVFRENPGIVDVNDLVKAIPMRFSSFAFTEEERDLLTRDGLRIDNCYDMQSVKDQVQKILEIAKPYSQAERALIS